MVRYYYRSKKNQLVGEVRVFGACGMDDTGVCSAFCKLDESLQSCCLPLIKPGLQNINNPYALLRELECIYSRYTSRTYVHGIDDYEEAREMKRERDENWAAFIRELLRAFNP